MKTLINTSNAPFKFSTFTLALGTILLAIGSCSVKEDRDACPSHLTVDLRGNTSPEIEVLLSSSEGEILANDIIGKPALKEGGYAMYRYRIPKGDNGVSSLYHGSNLISEANTLLIRDGYQMDSLYGEHAILPISQEIEYHKPVFHKQFSTIDLILATDGTMDSASGVPLPSGLSVKAQIGMNAVSKVDLSPIKGETIFEIPFSEKRRAYSFRVPRMYNEKILVTITDSSSGKELNTLDIGAMLLGAGFDWSEEDLGDALIISDKYDGRFIVSISSWGKRTIEIIL